MCNIAGYAGKNNAAPILIEMLKRQQYFDGAGSAGIATIYNGKIYTRKVIGDVDTLIKTTDALYLPGTVGIAHTRPTGIPQQWGFAHPFLTSDETMAGMTNGSTAGVPEYPAKAQSATEFLEEQGYVFRAEEFLPRCTFPKIKCGAFVSCVETRTNMVHYYVSQGMSIPEAMSKVASTIYADNVLGILSLNTPDRFYINRTTRPAATMETDDGTYVATSAIAFPDEAVGTVGQLPVMYPCEISADGITVHEEYKMSGCDEVYPLTAESIDEGYVRISKMLEGKKETPLDFDDLERAVGKEMRDLFPKEQRLIQDAEVVYHALYRLYKEGKLNRTVAPNKNGVDRYYMWI